MPGQQFAGLGVATWVRAVLCCGLIAATAQAQINSGQYPNQNPNQPPNPGQNQNQGQKPNQGQAPPATPAPKVESEKQKKIDKDQAAILAAQKDWADAAQKLTALTTQYLNEFHQRSDRWSAGQKKLSDAKASLDTARQAVLDRLAQESDYQDAVTDKKKAQSDLDAGKAASDASPQTLVPLAQAVLAAATKVSKMENNALDDDTDVTAWKAKIAGARMDLQQLDADFLNRLAGTKDYKAAKDAVDAARQKVVDAQAKLAADSSQTAQN